jgi:hypothetical protein
MAESEKQDEGQVSEVSGLKKEADVSDGDSVAGQSDRGADEGPTGPDAPTFSEDQTGYSDKDDVETTG